LDGRNGIHKFLEQFFHSNEVLKELQKPLLDCGKPDVDILVAALFPLNEQSVIVSRIDHNTEVIDESQIILPVPGFAAAIELSIG
jgi:hypothetical protein